MCLEDVIQHSLTVSRFCFIWPDKGHLSSFRNRPAYTHIPFFVKASGELLIPRNRDGEGLSGFTLGHRQHRKPQLIYTFNFSLARFTGYMMSRFPKTTFKPAKAPSMISVPLRRSKRIADKAAKAPKEEEPVNVTLVKESGKKEAKKKTITKRSTTKKITTKGVKKPVKKIPKKVRAPLSKLKEPLEGSRGQPINSTF